MLSAVIFDVDGTLVDSVDLHAEAWREAFSYFGKEIPFRQVRSQIGKGADQLMPAFLSAQELEEFGEELDAFRSELYQSQYLPRVRAFPGVRELFLRLREDGVRVALASSAKGEELATYKRLVRIEDLLPVETSADEVERSKPHPDIFQVAMAELGHPRPKEVVVVGDTPYDAEAARRAHLQCIGVLCGGFPAEVLLQAGCLELYRDPEDLLARYERWVTARQLPVAPGEHEHHAP